MPQYALRATTVPLWVWLLVGFVVGLPCCAQLNCYIEARREEWDAARRARGATADASLVDRATAP